MVDRRGHGDSGANPEFSIECEQEDIAAVPCARSARMPSCSDTPTAGRTHEPTCSLHPLRTPLPLDGPSPQAPSRPSWRRARRGSRLRPDPRLAPLRAPPGRGDHHDPCQAGAIGTGVHATGMGSRAAGDRWLRRRRHSIAATIIEDAFPCVRRPDPQPFVRVFQGRSVRAGPATAPRRVIHTITSITRR